MTIGFRAIEPGPASRGLRRLCSLLLQPFRRALSRGQGATVATGARRRSEAEAGPPVATDFPRTPAQAARTLFHQP